MRFLLASSYAGAAFAGLTLDERRREESAMPLDIVACSIALLRLMIFLVDGEWFATSSLSCS